MIAAEIIVSGSARESRILVGERLGNLRTHLPFDRGRVVIITDARVNDLYGDQFPAEGHVIVIGPGEEHKTLATVETIYREMIDAGADRNAFVVGIGGGIVCDVAGFAASTYMRGVDFGFVATTLLAQVDASVGGKNGVNLLRYKNIVGTFNQPGFVVCDTEVLRTLAPNELCCGFAEIVKHMLIADAPMLDWLEEHGDAALALDQDVIGRLVEHSVNIKAAVVNRDEREGGERRKLNFGHTVGHAVEKLIGVPHGHAVSLGMVAASRLSEMKGYLQPAEVERIIRVLQRLGLPTSMPVVPDGLMAAMTRDKKREGDSIHFVLLDGIGKAITEKIRFAELEAALDRMV